MFHQSNPVQHTLLLQDFTSDFFFRQFWQDPRLAFEAKDGLVTLNIGSEYLKNLWVPDTYFPNEKTSYYHLATTSNEFLRIKPAGDILRSIRWEHDVFRSTHFKHVKQKRSRQGIPTDWDRRPPSQISVSSSLSRGCQCGCQFSLHSYRGRYSSCRWRSR